MMLRAFFDRGWAMFPALLLLSAGFAGPCYAAELDDALAKLRGVGPKGVGHKEASAAWPLVAKADAGQLTHVLAAMDGANPLAENWLRGACEAIAQRHEGKLPAEALESFLKETSHSPRARRLAFELLTAQDPTAPARLTPTFINDPSLELRRDAVAQLMEEATKQNDAGAKDAAIAGYQKAFAAARDLDQIKSLAEKLKSLEQKYDLPGHFGFITKWQIIGPFDNKDMQGFDVAYPPETVEFAANASYAGLKGDVSWQGHVTADEYGLVDLTKALDKHKGAIAYAYAVFESEKAQKVDFRLGSINANKLWVNGKLVFANNVYHAGISVDQYRGTAELKQGRNTILLKICQNEQTEPWAQDWNFQLRVCDAIGTAILTARR